MTFQLELLTGAPPGGTSVPTRGPRPRTVPPERAGTVSGAFLLADSASPGSQKLDPRKLDLQKLDLQKLDVVSRHALSARSLSVGRGPGNDLVLGDETVSGRQFRVWTEGGQVYLEESGSRNGTWRNGERLQGTVPLAAGDVLRAGLRTYLRVVEAAVRSGVPVLQDLASGLHYTFERDRFQFAEVPGAPPGESRRWLALDPDGEITLEGGETPQPVVVDRPFVVHGREYCLREPIPGSNTTAIAPLPHEQVRTRYPYVLMARVNGATGPEASITCAETLRSARITADNRALLLYVLGRKFAADLAGGSTHDDAGWCHDEEVAVAIWGRAQATAQLPHLNVLVWRVRRELESAGLDPACLEKRKKHLRVRIERADLP